MSLTRVRRATSPGPTLPGQQTAASVHPQNLPRGVLRPYLAIEAIKDQRRAGVVRVRSIIVMLEYPLGGLPPAGARCAKVPSAGTHTPNCLRNIMEKTNYTTARPTLTKICDNSNQLTEKEIHDSSD